MIRLIETHTPKRLPPPRQREWMSESWDSLERRLESWVRTRPVLTLLLAASAGAALGWLIKRRR